MSAPIGVPQSNNVPLGIALMIATTMIFSVQLMSLGPLSTVVSPAGKSGGGGWPSRSRAVISIG